MKYILAHNICKEDPNSLHQFHIVRGKEAKEIKALLNFNSPPWRCSNCGEVVESM